MSPRVSVVVASFSSTGRDTLESLDRQSLPVSDFEIVIVPDAPDPRIRERMNALAENRPNVRLQPDETSGSLGARRNAGASVATGDYLLFLEDGVVLGDQALERMCNFADEATSDICLGRTSRGGTQLGSATTFVVNQPRVSRDTFLLESLAATKIYSRTFFEKSGLRFADGSRQSLDLGFDLDAISRTDAISALADYPAFAAARERSLADAPDDLAAVDGSSAPEDLRYQALLAAHLYNLGLLLTTSRVGPKIANHPDLSAFQEAVNSHVPPALDERLGAPQRELAAALRAGDLETAARLIDGHKVRLRLRNVTATWDRGVMQLDFDVASNPDDASAPLRTTVGLALCIYRATDGTEWRVPAEDMVLAADSSSGDVHITTRIRPDTVAAGQPLPLGTWIPALRVGGPGLDRRVRIPFSRGSAGASHVAGRTTVSFNDAGKLSLDVGATTRGVLSKFAADLASVSEDSHGSLLRVELTGLDLPHDTELAGHLRIRKLPVPATIRVDGGRPVLQAWVSGLAGSYPLATKFSSAPYTPTGLVLEVDGVGAMTTRGMRRKPQAETESGSTQARTPPPSVSSTTARKLKRAVKRVPGAVAIYRRVRASRKG